MQQLGQGIFYEDSYMGVTVGALAFPGGTILIDAPLRAEDVRSWRLALINQHAGATRLLISLDAHPDRTLGARALECTILAHKETAHIFQTRSNIFKGQNADTGAIWETYDDAIGMRWAAPDITFTQKVFWQQGEPEIVLLHQPCSTPEAIWVAIPDRRVVFVGDTVVPKQPPFMANADLDAWLEILDLLLKSYRNYAIVSGRGALVSNHDIRAQQNFLKKVIKAMERLARRNAPPEEARALASRLITDFKAERDLREQYEQRLQYGLYHCYARRYLSTHPPVQESQEGVDA